MLNKVMLIGRLVKDVELRNTANGKVVASGQLATNKSWKDANGQKQERVEFHNLTIWNGSENFAKYTSKGSLVYIDGELMTDVYEKDGIKKYSTKVNVNNFTFLESKKSEKFVKNEDGSLGTEEVEDNYSVSEIPF